MIDNDPFMKWQEEFNGDGLAATTQNAAIDSANIMFKRLFRYMLGVNAESKEIQLTKPVTDQRTPIEGVDKVTKHELCFWAGPEYTYQELPAPVDNSTYVVKKQPMVAFVK